MRTQILRVPAEGAACQTLQHHEGNPSPPRKPPEDAIRGFGQQLVRPVLRRDPRV